jgi:hypothetical protein
VDWSIRRYELFDRFDAGNDHPDDERYIVHVHRSLGYHKLYVYSDVSVSRWTRWVDNVVIRDHITGSGLYRNRSMGGAYRWYKRGLWIR